MADEILTFRTIRVVDTAGNTSTIIADQEQDVVTFEAGANVNLVVVDDDRIVVSTQSPIGFTGSRGYNGSIGFQGSQGDRGLQGSRGPTGFNGSYGYTGSRGFTGSQGNIGNVGYSGSVGFTGSRGEDSIIPGYTGSQGPSGPTGFTGSQGGIGNIGFTGSQGFTGSVGYQGSLGFIGFTGSRGVTGFSGSDGPAGPSGYDGSRGKTGYSGSRGYTGSRGIQGIQGPTGIRGYTGSRGVQGQDGDTGFTGSKGFAGSVGYTGSKGGRGPQGPIGIGYTGSQGVRGYTGSKGSKPEAFRTFRHQNTQTGLTDLIIADQVDDVVTFVSGYGMVLDFNEGTDTITFAVNENMFDGGGGGQGNAIVDINVVNNAPSDASFITWDSETQVLAYTPIDVSEFATTSSVVNLFQESKDYANVLVEQEALARENADQAIYDYVYDNISRLEDQLGGNVIIINDAIDEANVYLQGLIADEASIRANADSNLQAQIDALTVNAGNILIDLDANVTILQQQIQEVESNSIIRDNELQDNIDDVSDALAQEVLDRIAGDQAIQDNLDANITLVNGRIDIVEQDLSDETNARISGDAALQVQIDTNTNNLANVANDLAQETLDRISGDSNLQNQISDTNGNLALVDNRIDQEILDRIAGDEALQANLETSVNLINADIDLLGNAIQTEANIRANADQALSGRIDVEAGRNDTQDGEIDDLDARVAELENRVEFAIDYEANLTELGAPNTQVPTDGQFIPMVGLPGAITGFTLDGPGVYGGGEQCSGGGFRAVLDTGSGSGAVWKINPNATEDGVASVELLDPGTGFQAGDRFRIEAIPGVCFGPVGYAYIDIDSVSTNTVTNQWEDVRALYINAVDDEGTFHFLDGIKEGDDLVFQHRTQPSFCRMEVTANVTLTTQAALSGTANVEVVPVAFNGDVLPGNGSIQSDYIVQFFPSVAGDVPTYDYVDTQDNRRVLKTGDEMTGALHMKGGDVIAYGNTGSRIRAVEGADIDIADDGSLVISGTGSVSTNKITNIGGSSINLEYSGSGRLQIASSGTYFLNKPAKYTYFSAGSVGNDQFDLIHKEYLDTRINNLDLANTYVAKSGDTMFGELVFDDNVVDAIKLAPVDGSQVNINYFDGTSSSVTLVDLHLRGNTENNRYRILGGASAADALVTYTASGNVYYNTDVSLTGNRITSLRDPAQDSDAANKSYVDGAITQSQTDIEDVYVAVAGDTMTGQLTISGGGLRISNSQDINVEGGDVRVTNSGNLVTNTWKSVGDSNMAIMRKDITKLNIYSTHTLSSQPIRYGGSVAIADNNDLITKSYVDGNFILNGDTTVLKGSTTVDTSSNRMSIKGAASGLGFQITQNGGVIMFYQEGNDIRVNNHAFDNDHSVVNRIKGDERYGLKEDFVKKSGDTMTGPLTLTVANITTALNIKNPNNNINFSSGAFGKLIYDGQTRFQIGNNKSVVKGSLEIEDGLASDTGLPVDGQINMNNRKIVNLLNPEDPQDAATKNYVDEKVGQGGGDFIKANGDTDITAESTVTLKGVKFNIKSENSGTGFQIKRSDGQTLFYSFGNDIRVVNNEGGSDNSILNRNQMDLRYLNQDAISILTRDTTIKSDSNASFYIQNKSNSVGNFFKVLSYSGSELFGVDGDGMVRVPKTPTQDNHVANKKYVDDKVENASGGGVELYGSSSPPSSKDRGTLLMTSTNNLYIYV